MEPDLEVVSVHRDESFKMWSHGYPFRTVRWHFHPEYEIHLITDTAGKAFVGDYVGDFAPGNLVMIGPNLPHNWISAVPQGEQVPERCLVLQFTEASIRASMSAFPELGVIAPLLEESARGVEFPPVTGAAAAPIMHELLDATGARRIALFLDLLDLLCQSRGRRLLAGIGCRPDPSEYMAGRINHVLAHIGRNIRDDLGEGAMARLSGYSPSAFSRAFRRHTGLSFVQYVTRMRVNLACQMLMHDDTRVVDICYQAGFNNLSNFNRQFRAQKGISPSEFRSHHRMNDRVSRANAAMSGGAGAGAMG